jgi:hypothetical protein
VHAIILERGRVFGFFFDEMQNGAIWGHFRVSYNIESSTILMTDNILLLLLLADLIWRKKIDFII